jgi:hypothetical protein
MVVSQILVGDDHRRWTYTGWKYGDVLHDHKPAAAVTQEAEQLLQKMADRPDI